MATFKFYLTNPAGKDKARLFLKIFYKGSTIRITSPYTVPVDRWMVTEQRCGSARKVTPQENLINDHLNALKERAEEFFMKCLTEGRVPGKEEIEAAIQEKKEEPQGKSAPGLTFEEAFKEFYQSPSLSSHQKRRDSTTRAYKPVLTKLKAYAKSKPSFKLRFESFDKKFFHDFTSYLEDEGLENNTIGSYFKRIKAFLNWAQEQGYHTSTDFMRYKVLKEEKPVVFLNKMELDHLINFDLTKSKKLDETRDLFVLQCVTGLRVSDLMLLDQKHIMDDTIHMRSQKTGGQLTIPLNKISKSILEKYPKGLPKKSSQKYNEYLKELAELTELERKVPKHIIRGNKVEASFITMSEAISSHTGRRTFITQCLERGIAPHIVMSFTGHSDLKTMYRYIGYTEDEKSRAMQSAWDS